MKQADIHIIDDDESTREALVWLLESADLDVASHDSAESFLGAVALDQVGCLVLDVRMPGISGMDLLEILCDRGTTLKTIILTGHGDVPMAVRAMNQGAFYFLQKPVNGPQLVSKVQEALTASRETYEQQRKLTTLQKRFNQLTPRERQVIALVIEGNTNKVISAKLHIVERTVEVHRKNAMEKMEAGSLAELIPMVQEVLQSSSDEG